MARRRTEACGGAVASLLLALLLLQGCRGLAPPVPDVTRPSFLIVFTDDQRHDSLGCTGNPYLDTPHLDRLAREGVVFETALVAVSPVYYFAMHFCYGLGLFKGAFSKKVW